MNAFADAWGHANNVRMWLGQAATELAGSAQTTGGFFSKLSGGRAEKAKLDEAAASLAQARLAWIDLRYWLERAGQVCPPAPPTLVDGFLRPPADTLLTAALDFAGSLEYELNDNVVADKRRALARDIAALDGLIGWLDQKQRAKA